MEMKPTKKPKKDKKNKKDKTGKKDKKDKKNKKDKKGNQHFKISTLPLDGCYEPCYFSLTLSVLISDYFSFNEVTKNGFQQVTFVCCEKQENIDCKNFRKRNQPSRHHCCV